MTDTNGSDLMTVAEVATITRLSAGTLRYYLHRGTGPASFKLGRRVVYRRSAVIVWIDQQGVAETRRP